MIIMVYNWKKINNDCSDMVSISEEQKQTEAYVKANFEVFKENGLCNDCRHKGKSLDWHRLKGLSFIGHVNKDLEQSCYCNLYESD